MKCAPFKQEITAPLHTKSALSYTSELGAVAPPDPYHHPTTSQPPRNVSRTRYPSLPKGGYTLVTLPRIVTPYRDSVYGTRARVTYQKLVTR